MAPNRLPSLYDTMHFSLVTAQQSASLDSTEVADGAGATQPARRCDVATGAGDADDATGRGGNALNWPTMSEAVARTSSTRDMAVKTV